MAKRVQFIRHTTGNADAFKGLEGEVTVDITKKTLRVHDGVNAGGTEVAKADLTNVNAATATSDGKMSATHVQMLEDAIPKVSGATAGNLPKLQADGTIVDSGKNFAYAEFPAGTRMVFAQAAAPTGWTQDTANNDAALRVVSSAGGGTGGVHGLSSPPSTAHSHTIPAHSHTVNSHTHSVTVPSHRHMISANIESIIGSDGGTRVQGAHCKSSNVISSDYFSIGEAVVYTGGIIRDEGRTKYLSLSSSLYGIFLTDTPYESSASSTSSAASPGTNSVSQTSDSSSPTAFQPKYVDVIIAQKD